MKHMQKVAERTCWDHLMQIAGNEKHRVSLDVCGPTLVVVEGGPCTGWTVAVGVEHDKLLGQPPVVSALPIGGVFPPDAHWHQAVQIVFDDAVKNRDSMSNVPAPKALTPQKPVVQERPKHAPRERVSHFKSDPNTKDDFGSENAKL